MACCVMERWWGLHWCVGVFSLPGVDGDRDDVDVIGVHHTVPSELRRDGLLEGVLEGVALGLNGRHAGQVLGVLHDLIVRHHLHGVDLSVGLFDLSSVEASVVELGGDDTGHGPKRGEGDSSGWGRQGGG